MESRDGSPSISSCSHRIICSCVCVPVLTTHYDKRWHPFPGTSCMHVLHSSTCFRFVFLRITHISCSLSSLFRLRSASSSLHAIKKESGRHRDLVDGDVVARWDDFLLSLDYSLFATGPSLISISQNSNYPLQLPHYFQVIMILSIRFLFHSDSQSVRERIRLFLLPYLSFPSFSLFLSTTSRLLLLLRF